LVGLDGVRLGSADLGRAPDPLALGHVCEPRLTKLANGTVLLAYRAGSARLSVDGRVALLRSADGGMSWEWLGTPFPSEWDGRRGDQLLAVLAPTGGDGVVAWLGWMDRSDDRPWRNRETEGRLPLRILQAESADAGRTWGPVREIGLDAVEQAVPQYLLALQDGSLLAGFETFKHYDDPAPWRYQAGVTRSVDGGATWSSPRTAAEVDARGRMWWDPRAAQLPDGRLVQCYHAFDYPAGRDADLHVAWSADAGRSWSAPLPTGLAGQVTSPVPLGAGNLVLLQQRRHAPAGIVAVLAGDDEPFTAGDAVLVYTHETATLGAADGNRPAVEYFDDMDGFTFGHPAAVGLDDGSVLVAYYAGRRGHTAVHLSRLASGPTTCLTDNPRGGPV
jgi:hypothetical protein